MQYFRAQSCAYDNDVTQPKTPLADFTSPTISTRLAYNQDPFMMKQVGFVETFIAAIIFIFSVPELIPDQKRAETSSKWQRKAVHPGKNFSKW